MSSKYRAVLFDLYGVLGLNGWQAFKAKHFVDNIEGWEELRQLGQSVDAGKANEAEYVQAVAKKTGVSTAEIQQVIYRTKPNKPLLAFIEKYLQGYKIGLLSNASHDVIDGIFSPAEQRLFDAIVLSAHIGITKPDPRSYQFICEQLKVVPAQCVMVDDQPRHLVQASLLGMGTICYESYEQTAKALKEALDI